MGQLLGAVNAKLGVVVSKVLAIKLNRLRRYRHFEYLMLFVGSNLDRACTTPIGSGGRWFPRSLLPDDLGEHPFNWACRFFLLLLFLCCHSNFLVLLFLRCRLVLRLRFPFAYKAKPQE